jgi:hypothetical protein
MSVEAGDRLSVRAYRHFCDEYAPLGRTIGQRILAGRLTKALIRL